MTAQVVSRSLLLTLLLAIGVLHAANLTSAWQIDGARSQALFAVRVLWLHTINGRFTRIRGEMLPGPEADTVVVNASIDVDSAAMASARTRRWMLAPDFFDAARYPQIHFVSDPLSMHMLEHGGELSGLLSMRGRIHPVRFQLLPSRCALDQARECVIAVYGSIQRSDFDMRSYPGTMSDRVELELEVMLDTVRN